MMSLTFSDSATTEERVVYPNRMVRADCGVNFLGHDFGPELV